MFKRLHTWLVVRVRRFLHVHCVFLFRVEGVDVGINVGFYPYLGRSNVILFRVLTNLLIRAIAQVRRCYQIF